MKPSVAIIIPTYNRAPELKRLLSMLIAQTEPPDQIIVVDDHSSDDTESIVKSLSSSRIEYVKNQGRYQRDGKLTGLKHLHSEYAGFLDDDVVIKDTNFFASLRCILKPDYVIQAKAIMQNLGKVNKKNESWHDFLAVRPYPILELVLPSYNTGQTGRRIYPLIEFGNFWHASLANIFIDKNFILDAFGESYASSLRIYRKNIPMILMPSLVIEHPGSISGGSQRFNKKSILRGLTEFHAGYFHNMIYIHARYYPWFIWAWLPFYTIKSVISLFTCNNLNDWLRYSFYPMRDSLIKFFWRRHYE